MTPLAHVDNHAAHQRRAAARDAVGTPLQFLTVLLVEDSAILRRFLARILERRGASVLTASNGAEGLEIYRSHRPDVVVTDIRMPVMDGLEMAARVRQLDRRAPIVVLTAYDDASLFMRSIEIGVDRYVLKPVAPEDLVATVQRSAELLRKHRELEEKNRYIHFILDINPAFIVTFVEGELEYINQTFLEYLGYSSLEEFMASDKGLTDFFAQLDGVPCEGRTGLDWIRHLTHNPEVEHVVHLHDPRSPGAPPKSYVVSFNGFSGLDSYIFTFIDISRMESERLSLQREASTDALTGLCNRRKFDEILPIEVSQAERSGCTLSLLMFDIDHFKRVNDTWGHRVGDGVLEELGRLLKQTLRQHETAARWGGEEFMILLPGCGVDEAKQLAERLRALIAQHRFRTAGTVTGSFGVAEHLRGETVHEFTHRTDKALYNAKNNGRNRVECAPARPSPGE